VRYLASKSGVILKTVVGFVQGHWKWHYLIDRIQGRAPQNSVHSTFKLVCTVCAHLSYGIMSTIKGSTSKDKDKEPGKESIYEACRNEYKDDNSRALECERCERHFCAKCVKITDEVYDMVTQRKNFHWYCGVCESKVMQCIQLEKDIERKLVDFMGKVEYKMKTVEGNVYTKLAELEEKFNEKLKEHVTHQVVEEALQKVNEKAMSYAEKTRTSIKEDLTTEIAVDMKENIITKITGDLKEAQTVLQETTPCPEKKVPLICLL